MLSRQGIKNIFYGDLVNSIAIYAHSPTHILLWGEEYEDGTGTHALSNVPLAQKLIDLPLELFIFYKAHLIMREILEY